MKLSEKKLRKIIRKEINEAMDREAYRMADGLVSQPAIRKLENAILEIMQSLKEEGFSNEDALRYIGSYLNKEYGIGDKY